MDGITVELTSEAAEIVTRLVSRQPTWTVQRQRRGWHRSGEPIITIAVCLRHAECYIDRQVYIRSHRPWISSWQAFNDLDLILVIQTRDGTTLWRNPQACPHCHRVTGVANRVQPKDQAQRNIIRFTCTQCQTSWQHDFSSRNLISTTT